MTADFSAANNPNGDWSYGWSSSLSSAFNLYPDQQTLANGNPAWHDSSQGFLPLVYSSATLNILVLHPSADVLSVARWTAPSSGIYSVSATYNNADAATTDVHVLQNGISLFDATIDESHLSQAFSGASISLIQGDTIDFAVGDGNNTSNFDSTGLSATITSSPVPIPAAVWLFASSLAGLGLFGKRHKTGRKA